MSEKYSNDGKTQGADVLLVAAHLRAARALLDWSAKALSERSGVSPATLQRLERSVGVPSAHPRTIGDLKRVLEDAGVEFMGTPDEPGVILRRPKQDGR
ncbi:transcriptional regulator [Alsobacter soli]|uniref:Transcriptional regulator n=1 Tax=Alsobacter soli TaxID=2109933 RepID=A0A2T1HY79_9HYPH|nr:helix-turn-helix transcriptional regulator [Alsobacter soli]PSC06540.1 transcriptional regulator [Alsobacter soli]